MSSALNEAWLEEYRATTEELEEINQDDHRPSRAVRTFAARLEQKGSSVRSDVMEAICAKYADFAAIYANLDDASAMAALVVRMLSGSTS